MCDDNCMLTMAPDSNVARLAKLERDLHETIRAQEAILEELAELHHRLTCVESTSERTR